MGVSLIGMKHMACASSDNATYIVETLVLTRYGEAEARYRLV